MHRKLVVNIGIKHDFPFINIRTDPREVLKSLMNCTNKNVLAKLCNFIKIILKSSTSV